MLKHSTSMSLRRSARVSAQPGQQAALPTVTAASTKATKRAKRIVEPATVSEGAHKRQRKSNGITDNNPGASFKKPEVPHPSTPRRKRQTSAKEAAKAPPLTPTPSLINILRASYSTGDIDDATPPPYDRPVEPHVTNATLVTPGGTQTVTYPSDVPDASPSKTGLPRPTATTGTLLDQACAHLIAVDGRMRPLIEAHRCNIFSVEGLAEEIDPFRSLASGIMGQQVSGAAAKSIKNKFIALFNQDLEAKAAKGEHVQPVFPTPAQVAVTSIERLRMAGLSQRKAEYIQGLAEKFVTGELTTPMLMKASDEEVMEKLIAVRGLGKWSVEMFACFGLKRMDILSTGDLGVQRGMAHFYGKDVQKLKAKGGGKWKYMSEQDMLDKSAAFAPYRSLFMWYMWRVEDVDISVMQ